MTDTFVDPDKLIHTLTAVNKLNRERLAAEKAKVVQAELDAAEAAGWFSLIKWHTGQAGLKNGVYHDCEASENILRSWINQNHHPPIIDADSLETAFHACKDRLPTAPQTPYERRTNTQESRVLPQMKTLPPKAFIGMTRDQVLNLEPSKLRKLMARGPEYVARLNEILAGK